jgi:hypothetical protein
MYQFAIWQALPFDHRRGGGSISNRVKHFVAGSPSKTSVFVLFYLLPFNPRGPLGRAALFMPLAIGVFTRQACAFISFIEAGAIYISQRRLGRVGLVKGVPCFVSFGWSMWSLHGRGENGHDVTEQTHGCFFLFLSNGHP